MVSILRMLLSYRHSALNLLYLGYTVPNISFHTLYIFLASLFLLSVGFTSHLLRVLCYLRMTISYHLFFLCTSSLHPQIYYNAT
jgi:hypothetical protein